MMGIYFLDSNVIISGLLWKGKERRILELAESGRIELLTSEYVLKEVERVLGDKFDFSARDVSGMIETVSRLCSVTTLRSGDLGISWGLTDKKDAPIVAAAIASASVLVTGDKRLALEAKKHVRVMTPAELLRDFSA